MVIHGRKIKQSFEELTTAFHGWAPHLKAWEENFKNSNMRYWGVESPSYEERQREARRLKLKKQRENCLHGKTGFIINWSIPLKCPRCYSRSVHIGERTISCLLCGWSKSRVNGGKK